MYNLLLLLQLFLFYSKNPDRPSPMHGSNVNSTTLDNIEHTSPSGLFIIVSQCNRCLEFYKNYFLFQIFVWKIV